MEYAMHRNRSASFHQFSMVPRADIPRSAMRMQKTYKTTMDCSYLYPFFCEEVLPGDKWRLDMTAFSRLATPLFPIMDNLRTDCFFFFCPNRLVWDNWQKFMGEQLEPEDTIDFTIPQMATPVHGPLTLGDYFGLPTSNDIPGDYAAHSSLPFRMYNLIYNEWFRDQNLTNSAVVDRDDGPDALSDYFLRTRAKRHDYFTSCLPFPQKSAEGVSIPITGTGVGFTLQPGAPILTSSGSVHVSPLTNPLKMAVTSSGATPNVNVALGTGASGNIGQSATAVVTGSGLYPTNLYADLSEATAGTINALRTAFQVQKLLERDARGGTRYTEIVRSHFGVISPDARLQRPEYLGGSSVAIAINPVAQTSATAADGTDTPQGTLSAIGTGLLRAGFTQAFTEHGYIIGIINTRADITYQQGRRRHWRRRTRYDFYFPAFAHLGEQAVECGEIFALGETSDPEANSVAFGYQERWAEYRYFQNEITGLFRSSHPQTIDPWHLSEFFVAFPSLNDDFIRDKTVSTLQRAIAVGAAANGQQLICDMFFDCTVVRPMPMYSVPGMVDHF